MPDVWSAFDTIYEPLKHLKAVNDLEKDNPFVLSDDNSENKSGVEVNSSLEANEAQAVVPQDIGGCADADQKKATTDPLPESSSSAGVEAALDSDPAMDLSQTDSSAAVDTDSQPMDCPATESSVPIVDSAPKSETIAGDDHSVESVRATTDSSGVGRDSVDNDSTAAANSVQASSPIADESALTGTDVSATSTKTLSSGDASELQQLLSRINDLKVAELRAELEKRGLRLKGNLKKADLISKLRQVITQLLEDEDVVSDEVKNDWWAQRILSKENANEDNEEIAENKTTDDEVIDEEALLKEDDSEANANETSNVDSNDVVMIEKETEGEQDKEDKMVAHQASEEDAQEDTQMVVDSIDQTKDGNEDKVEDKDQVQNGVSEKTPITQNGYFN